MSDDATMKQVSEQCRVVAHLARAIADVHDDYEKVLANGGLSHIAESVGRRTASLMEMLGDVLNGMDAVSDDDEWTAPIFAEAQRRWPVDPAA